MRALCAPLILSTLVLLAASHAHEIKKRASQFDESMQKVMEKGMVFAGGVIEKLKDSEVARKLIGKALGAVGGSRAKRSLRIDTQAASYNVAQYQKVELYKTVNKDSNGADVQQALTAFNKVINGQKVGYFIPKPKQS